MPKGVRRPAERGQSKQPEVKKLHRPHFVLLSAPVSNVLRACQGHSSSQRAHGCPEMVRENAPVGGGVCQGHVSSQQA